MARQLLLNDSDLPFLINMGKIVSEGKFEIKGDSIITIANVLKYLTQFQERVKQVPDVPAEQPLVSEVPKPRRKKD